MEKFFLEKLHFKGPTSTLGNPKRKAPRITSEVNYLLDTCELIPFDPYRIKWGMV